MVAGFLQPIAERMLELVVGRIPGSGPPTPAQEAAGAIFLSVSKAAGAPGDHDHRTIDEILRELVTTVDMIEATSWHYGVEAGRARRNGNLSVDDIVYRLRDDIISPRLDEWRPRLRAHLAGRGQLTIAEAEAEWQDRNACLRSLEDMRLEARPYLDTLAGIAGNRAASKRAPAPPSKAIDKLDRAQPVARRSDDRPNQSMVRWFDPTSIPAHVSTLRKANKDLKRLQHKTQAGPSGFAEAASTSKPAVYPRAKTAVSEPSTAAVDDIESDIWVDYVADMGDAIDPTLAVAWLMCEPSLSLPTHRKGERPWPPAELPRGELLVLGGDLVYPHASKKIYANHLVLPYRLAADPLAHDSQDEPAPKPQVVAIPGNHDWLGGIEPFENLFCGDKEQTFAEHWTAPQSTRYWAIDLVGDWWMWGIDTGLHDEIDDGQQAFFKNAANALNANSKVIICSPVPFWQLYAKRPQKYDQLQNLIQGWLDESGATAPYWLAGDSHFFAHYEMVKGRHEHHITAGGGGAFLQPTHNLSEQVPSGDNDPTFKLDARWPRPIDSRGKAAGLSGLADRQFRRAFVAIGLAHAGYAALIRWGRDNALAGDTAGDALRWALGGWRGWPLLALFLIGITLGTAPNSVEKDLRRGALQYGAIHGAIHVALMVLVATGALWIGDAVWWVYLIAPLIGGFITTAVFVSGTRAINREIKASDTLAYSPAHATGYKHFVRMRFSPDGDMSMYVIGIDRVGTGWYEALTGTERRSWIDRLRRRDGKVPSLPPTDGGRKPQLHYVWGTEHEDGTEIDVRRREADLGVTHRDTIKARSTWATKLVEVGDMTRAVTACAENVNACGRQFGEHAAETLEAQNLFADVLIANDEADRAKKPLAYVLRKSKGVDHAHARVRLLAAMTEGPADLEAWVREQHKLAAASDWQTPLVELLNDDAAAVGNDDPLLQLLIAHWSHSPDADQALDSISALIDGDDGGTASDSPVTVLGRRLLAQRHLERGQRDQAVSVLEQNRSDRTSLRQRRELALSPAGEMHVDELMAIRDDAQTIARNDAAFKQSFLLPVRIELGMALSASDRPQEAIDVLTACYKDAPGSNEALTALNSALAKAGRSEIEPAGTRADEGSSDGERHVHIGRVGPSPKGLAGIGGALASVAALVTTVFNPFTDVAPTECRELGAAPRAMVVGFEVPAGNEDAERTADQLARLRLVPALSGQTSGGSDDAPAVDFCTRTMRTMSDADYEQLAKDKNASVIVTATLTATLTDENRGQFQPQFYVPVAKLDLARELAGLYNLGPPVSFIGDFDTDGARELMTDVIVTRSEALLAFVRALSLYEAEEPPHRTAAVRFGEIVSGTSSLGLAVDETLCDSSGAETSGDAILGLSYVFLGNINLVVHASQDDPAALALAGNCFSMAVLVGTPATQPRARFGVAEVTFQQGKAGCGLRRQDSDIELVRSSYAQYQETFATYGELITAASDLDATVTYGFARVAQCIDKISGDPAAVDQAVNGYRRVVEEFSSSAPIAQVEDAAFQLAELWRGYRPEYLPRDLVEDHLNAVIALINADDGTTTTTDRLQKQLNNL